MARLFRRAVEVLITRIDESSFFKVGPNAAKITGLRVAFNVEKQLSKDPNTCNIEISNLSEDTRAALQQKPLKLFLSAGYEDELKQIFAGDIRWTESMRVQTGWTTKIQVGDGERAMKNARTNRSYIGGVKYGDVIKQLTDDMGLSIPTNLSEAKEFTDRLVNGDVMQGPSSESLERMLESKGFRFSIQDETLQVLKNGEARRNIALVVNKDNGMIGTPGFGSPSQKGKPAMLKIDNLLYPEVNPGIKLQVESLTANGLFRAERVQHVGDTHGSDWTTAVEATPL